LKHTWVIPVIASILILGALGFSQDAFAVTILSDQTSCDDLRERDSVVADWDDATQTCTITGFAMVSDASPAEFEFVIPDGATLHIIQEEGGGQALFTINDKVTNNGHVKMTLDLHGKAVGIDTGLFRNNDEFVNNGKISILSEDIVIIGVVSNKVQFENHGVFLNNGEIEVDNLNTYVDARLVFISDGEFVNSCTGEIRLGQISGSKPPIVDISGTFVNGGIYVGTADPDIQDVTLVCTSAVELVSEQQNTIDALQAIIDELLANVLSTFSTTFVQPILDAVDALITSGDIDSSEEGSLTRTLDRSLTTAERADGIACKGAAALLDDVNDLIATTDLTQADAKDLIDRAKALVKSCTP